MIGAKGVYLSGGEQQRITIARAVLKNAPILILDEATAFADPDNEARGRKGPGGALQRKNSHYDCPPGCRRLRTRTASMCSGMERLQKAETTTD